MDRRYFVQFWSKFNKKWMDYSAITHNSKTVGHPTCNDAEAEMANLARAHPHDKFQIEGRKI